MTTPIECYLNDGANWQAQSVLGYLHSIKESIVEKTWSDSNKRFLTHYNSSDDKVISIDVIMRQKAFIWVL